MGSRQPGTNISSPGSSLCAEYVAGCGQLKWLAMAFCAGSSAPKGCRGAACAEDERPTLQTAECEIHHSRRSPSSAILRLAEHSQPRPEHVDWRSAVTQITRETRVNYAGCRTCQSAPR